MGQVRAGEAMYQLGFSMLFYQYNSNKAWWCIDLCAFRGVELTSTKRRTSDGQSDSDRRKVTAVQASIPQRMRTRAAADFCNFQAQLAKS